MPRKKTAEEVLTSIIEASLKGDPVTALEGSVPEAYEGLRRVGRALSFMPSRPSYELTSKRESANEGDFLIRLESAERVIEAEAHLAQVRGAWKITALELLPGDEDWLHPQNARDALRFACEAALRGDGQELADMLTSAAFVDMMRITSAWGLLPVPDHYDIEPLDRVGDEERFFLHLKSGEHEVDVTASLARKDGEWVITSLKLPGIRD